MLNFYRYFFLAYALIFSTFCHAEKELLQTSDIDRIMKQIFEQHVDQKQMSSSVLKKSFKVYIDQFDPDRVYLLDSEVKPYLSMNTTEANRLVDEYKQGQFPEFQELNDVIQKAILRARTIRSTLEGSGVSQLFQMSDNMSVDRGLDWSDPDLKLSFAKSANELTQRTRQQIVKFIASERNRYGRSFVAEREPQTIRIFEKQARAHENSYLYEDENGRPLTEAERQNAFAMHVLKALANSLDAHTSVLNPSEAYDMRLRLEKEMPGLGIVVQSTPEGFTITQMVNDGPAAKSGLIHRGDKLLEIDGIQLHGLTQSKVMEMLQGKRELK